MTTPLIILALMALPLLAAWLVARRKRVPLDVARFGALGLALAFLFFSVGHFAMTGPMVEMLPPWVPARTLLVQVTGVLEIVVAAGLVTAKYRRPAGIAAMVVLVAFFPANVYAAWHGVGMGGHTWGPVYLLIRAPLQVVLLAWTYVFCVRRKARPAATD